MNDWGENETVIIGGGIGGLACAAALTRAGRAVTVLERRDEVADAGTALGMWPQALRALDALGLGDDVRRIAVEQTEAVFRGPDGARLFTARMREPVRLISRGALTKLLLGAVPDGAVRTGVKVSDVDSVHAGAVVGADGINSVVRQQVFGAAPPRYSGYKAWRGHLTGEYRPLGEILGRGKKFGITEMEGGRTNWFAPLWAPEGARHDGWRREFDGWCDPVPEILDRTAETDILCHDLYFVGPPLRTFVRGRVALIGDAAHAMTPDLGQGACQALIDGATLGDCLAKYRPDEALSRYDLLRRKSSQRVARAARQAGMLTMRPGLAAVRDGLLRAGALLLR